MYPVQQSQTAQPLLFFMVLTSDHITGATGLSPTVTISKNGGSFASPSGAVTEISSGWYKIAGNATDENTLGPLVIHATGTGADPCDMPPYPVVSYNPLDAVRMGLTALPNAAAEAAGGLYTRGTGAGQINQPANGQVDSNAVKVGGTTQTGRDIGASVLLSTGTGTGQLDFTSGVVKANLAQILGTALTETAGLIAAGFKQFFNVATPTGTVNSLPNAVPDASGGLPVTGNRLTAIPTVAAVTTVTTVTNLTNAPTNGDLTATMKTSVTTAATAATPTAGLSTLESSVQNSGTAQAGAATTITLAAGASATDNLYKGSIIKVYSGTGAGQSRVITGYVGSTKVATVNRAWATNPDNTSLYAVRVDETASVDASLKVAGVALTDTVTTYTGNTPQTGDAFARIGAAGASLTALGDTRIANLDATISSRTKPADTQAAVTTVTNLTNAPTSGDLTATMKASVTTATLSQANVRTAVGLSSANLDTQLSTIDDFLDTEVAAIKVKTDQFVFSIDNQVDATALGVTGAALVNIRAALGLASANLDTQLDALPTNAELATALGTADDAVLTAIAALNNLSQANIRTAVGLGSANLDTQLDALPTNAELATALGTADDAVLAAIAALNNLSQANVRTAVGLGSANLDTQLSAIAAYIDTEVAAIKAKTDNLPVDPADASDIAASFLSIASDIMKIRAAVYDSATTSGDTITLSNAATQKVTSSGRVTA